MSHHNRFRCGNSLKIKKREEDRIIRAITRARQIGAVKIILKDHNGSVRSTSAKHREEVI